MEATILRNSHCRAQPYEARRFEVYFGQKDRSQEAHLGVIDGQFVLPKVYHCSALD
jgi:hypothetical protein